MRIVRTIVQGEYDPAVLAQLRDPRCECTEAELREELTGLYQAHLVKQLASILWLYDGLLTEMALVDADIEAELHLFALSLDPEVADFCFGKCFVAGTLVCTPAGEQSIESIESGDLVWADSTVVGQSKS